MSFDPSKTFGILCENETQFVLIGGLAGVLQGTPTTTADVDILVKRDLDNLDRLSSALNQMGAMFWGSFPAARLGAPKEHIWYGEDFNRWDRIVFAWTPYGPLDIIFNAIGIGTYSDISDNALLVDINGADVLVADLDDVIASKEAAGRPQDKRDLPAYYQLQRQLKGGAKA